MFKNNTDNEADFCESYKSQILNTDSMEKESSFNIILKILTILLLLSIIVGVSIYGYNYFINQNSKNADSALPPISVQVSDDDLKVTEENEEEKEEASLPLVPTSDGKIKEADIDQIANDVKIAIANSEKEEKNSTSEVVKVEESEVAQETNSSTETPKKEEKSLEIPTSSPESKYLEELADLSKEIDKERK